MEAIAVTPQIARTSAPSPSSTSAKNGSEPTFESALSSALSVKNKESASPGKHPKEDTVEPEPGKDPITAESQKDHKSIDESLSAKKGIFEMETNPVADKTLETLLSQNEATGLTGFFLPENSDKLIKAEMASAVLKEDLFTKPLQGSQEKMEHVDLRGKSTTEPNALPDTRSNQLTDSSISLYDQSSSIKIEKGASFFSVTSSPAAVSDNQAQSPEKSSAIQVLQSAPTTKTVQPLDTAAVPAAVEKNFPVSQNILFADKIPSPSIEGEKLKTFSSLPSLGDLTQRYKVRSFSLTQDRQPGPHTILEGKPVYISFTGESGMQPKLSPVSTESLMGKLTELNLPVEQPSVLRSQQPVLRQDISAQFIDAKIQQMENKGGNSNAEQNPDLTYEQQANNNSLQTTAKISDTSQSSSFQQSLTQLNTEPPSSLNLNNTPRAGIPAFVTPFLEDNVIHQVSQKLRIQQMLQDAKVSIKLQPAELGELKIDIQMREGGVHASIVAQNQQVLDIIEKNMPRLKTLMEQQGLKIHELVVVLDPDVNSEQNLFQEQLSKEESDAEKHRPRHNGAQFSLSLEEEVVEQKAHETTNVNVKA